MKNYYTDKLSAEKLKRCYEIAPQRVQQYFMAEMNHVLSKTLSTDSVLELGCGWGRILLPIVTKAKTVFGIDTSLSSLLLAKDVLCTFSNCYLAQMNAIRLAFPDKSFDVVLCIQNGISAFHVDQERLFRESIRVTKPGGMILFSSYSEKFWNQRLEWFQLQSEAGLVGEIDYDKTKNGEIVCRDGFTATTISAARFKELTSNIGGINVKIEEVDESSLFCGIRVES